MHVFTKPANIVARLGWPVLAAAAMCVVLAGMPVGPLLPTVATLVVLLVATGNAMTSARRPGWVAAGSVSAAGVSVLATFCSGGTGDDELAAWLLVETMFLLGLVVQVVRAKAGISTRLTSGAVVTAVVLAPLRLSFEARAPDGSRIGAWCVGWTLLAALAVATGLYLRSLEEAREESVATARREQRLQLARDLHDWLGHEMTGLVLEAQAARMPGQSATATHASLQRIEEAGVRVLESIDRTLDWLRGRALDDLPAVRQFTTIGDIAVMVGRFEALGGTGVRLEVDDRAAEVSPELASTSCRVVLEALTNVRRHAPDAREVSVDVHRSGNHLIVRVANDGSRRPSLLRRHRAGGAGLRGLGERVTALGGTLWSGPVGPAGWAVHAVLPLKR